MTAFLAKPLHRIGFALQLDAGDATAKWQKVFPMGETRYRDDFGSLTFDHSFLSAMVRNYQAEGKPERPWDYFHRGSSDDTQVANEDKVASGWFSDMKIDADGLYVLTTWTAEARALIADKKLKYPSPTFSENATDPKTGQPCGPKLFSVALLNDPFLTDLPPVEASAQPKGTAMKLQLANLVAAAKLNADTTEENLEAALQAKATKLETLEAEVVQLKEKASKSDAGAGEAIRKLADRVEELGKELKASRDERATDAVTALQAKLEGEGRIIAAEKPMVATLVEKMGLAEATKFCATFPVKVDLKERGTNKAGPVDGMTPEEAHKQLELKAAELVKAGTPIAEGYRTAAARNPELAAAAVKLTAKAQAERNGQPTA